jgi:hypothetical protein
VFRRYNTLIFLSLFIVFSCDKQHAGLDGIFPGPGFEHGWSWLGMPTHYTPDDLYEYIDGEAELYLAYDFVEMATLTYFWGDAEDTSFVVDIYDMGTSLNGFGLYSSYRQPGYRFEEIGTEAVVSDYMIRFYQGRYVVEIRWENTSKRVTDAVRTVARQVSERIEDEAVAPAILSLLPAEDRMEKTLRYAPGEMLNQDFLPGGLEALYRVKGGEVTGFIVLFESANDAQEGLNRLIQFHKEMNRKIVYPDASDKNTFAVETAYQGYFLSSATGKFIAGVRNLSAPQKGLSLLSKMKKHLEQEES